MKQSVEEVRMKGRRIKTTPVIGVPKMIPYPDKVPSQKARKTVKRKATKSAAKKRKPGIKKKK